MTVDTPHGRHRRPRATITTIWVVAMVVLAIAWLQNLRQIQDSREREMESARKDLANLTRVSQEHADRTFHSADQVLRFVRSGYVQLGNRLDLGSMVEGGTIDASNFPQIGVIDPQGIYVLSNIPIPRQIDLSDREHFRVHLPAEDRGLFVSKPVLGRASGKWSIQLTRRITRGDGSLGGVAVLSVDPSYFTRFYGDLALGSQGVATLVGLDGVGRARRAGAKEEFGSDLSTSPLFQLIGDKQAAGFYESRSPVDGVLRLLHFRRLGQFPLVVVVGLSVDEVLANYRRTRDILLFQTAMVSVLVLALAAALARYVGRMSRELDERQRAQLLLQERNQQINAIFALSPDGFVAFDDHARVAHVNPAFRTLTGAERMELAGMPRAHFDAWLASRCQPGARWDSSAAQLALEAASRAKIVISAGRRVLQVGAREGEAPQASIILYFRDVTHETEVDQIKSEFLSTAAHELRTPMASVYGFAEVLLAQDTTDDERREYAQIIFDQAGNMARILDELLDLARMEARRGKDFKRVDLDLRRLVRDVIRAYRQPPGRDPPELVAPATPLPCCADPDKLRQALLNVLSNAYKYSPAGGPVSVELGHVGEPGSGRVCITVEDCGIGMNDEQQSRIFERFYRADRSGSLPGTGLGMSIVKEIFDLHGGTVTVVSVPAAGTTVVLCLPDAPVVCDQPVGLIAP